jgi:hypothetical protein
VPGETAASMVSVDRFQLEPRCRVCRNDNVRGKINDLLATGGHHRLDPQPHRPALPRAERRQGDLPRHPGTPGEGERRRLHRGVATAITPMAFLETVMVKGYQRLVDPDTKVDVNTAMIAAGRLRSLLDTRSGQPDMANILVRQNRIIEAVRSTVPESLWPEIIRKIDGEAEPAEPLDDQIETVDADDEGYDPMVFADEDDDL